jgi:hypothetical protein
VFLTLKSEKCVFCIHSLLQIYWRVSKPMSYLLLYMCLVRRLVTILFTENPWTDLYYAFICHPSALDNFLWLIISLLSFIGSYNTLYYNFVTMLQSIEQIGNRAHRMGITSSKLYLYSGTDIEVICSAGTTCAYS